jgi:hypothetical protein
MVRAARDGLVERGVVKQDRRRFAAQLQRDALHGCGAVAHNALTHRNRARERDLVHVRITHQLCPDDIPSPCDDVEKSLRKFSLVQRLE